jgi:predicted MFS family arabinose efflux permease
MTGIAVLLSLLAIVVALIKRGHLWKLVLIFVTLSILSFLITNYYVNSCKEDFCGIGQALIGSVISLGFALAAVIGAFQPKRSK